MSRISTPEQYAALVAELALRAPTVTDAEEIARIVNAHGLATTGEATETATGVGEWFEQLDPATDMRVAVDATGVVVGYGDVTDDGGLHTTFLIDVRMRPEAPASAPLLLDAMEARARALAQSEAALRLFVSEHDPALRALAEERGYRVVRSSYRMEMSLVGDLQEPVWPADITARPYKPAHDERIYEAHQVAFQDDWAFSRQTLEQWRSRNVGAASDPSLWCVAWDGDEVAGFCINRPERGDGVGWVDVLGVRAPWRGRGLGRALLLDACRTFRLLGRSRVGLGVDAENTAGALHLYESAGMHIVSRHDSWERTI